jgi:hypothetical protein
MANTTYNIDIQVQSKSLGQLEEELSQINAELKQVKVGSEAFKDLSKQSQNVTKQLEKVNNQIKGVTMEDKFTAANGAVKLLGGSLAGVVGTLGIFGVESEAFGEFEKRAASAIAVAVGFRDVAEGLRDMRTALKGVTVAQLKANAAALANPYVAVGAAVAALTVGLAKYASSLTDDVVPWTTSLKNAFLSFGDAAKYARLQTESYAEGLTKLKEAQDTLQMERSIAVLQAFGQETLDLEIALQERKLAALEEGSEEYDKAFTDILVLRAKRAKKQGEDQAAAFEKGRQEKLKQLQEKWKLEEDMAKLNKEWGEYQGDVAAESFAAMFNKTVKEEIDFGQGFIDSLEDADFEEELFGPTGMVGKFQNGLQEAIDKTIGDKANWDSFLSTANSAFDSLTDASQQRYDRELLNLDRQRSAIESNIHLSEEERIASLNRIEEKEKQTEIRRIKAERDQFQLKQMLILMETVMNAKMYAQEEIQIAKLNVSKATATAQEIALAGAAQVGKASMSLGSFVAALGPFGIAAFAVSIGGIIASIVSARKKAKAQIAAIGGSSSAPSGTSGFSAPSLPTVQQQAPQAPQIQPTTRTYVLSGDVTSAQEADAKLSRKRTLG